MKRRGFLSGALALGASPVAARTVMAEHQKPLPMLSPPITDGAGRSLTLADFSGRTVLLNIWATWCPPCRHEMPTLDRLQARLGGAEFHVLALSIDKGGFDIVRDFYAEIGITHLDLYLADQLRAMMAFARTRFPPIYGAAGAAGATGIRFTISNISRLSHSKSALQGTGVTVID